MKIKVSVPATSANVGSGFDALGLAVTLYNTVTFEESDKLDISAADGTRIPRNESNLVYRSAKGLFDKVGKKIPPLKIVQTNPIPMARGLGSSSACIIAGLLGANRMLGDVLNTQELLTLATSIEGHPDNVAPAHRICNQRRGNRMPGDGEMDDRATSPCIGLVDWVALCGKAK